MERDRVMRPNANCVASMCANRSRCSNHTRLTSAACCVRSTSSRRLVSNAARAPGTSAWARNASYSAIASSIASFVPLPIEKCAVAFASPSSTTLPIAYFAVRIIGKLRQVLRLVMSAWPSRSSANTPSRNRALAASSIRSSPARAQVAGSVSITQVLRPGSYW